MCRRHIGVLWGAMVMSGAVVAGSVTPQPSTRPRPQEERLALYASTGPMLTHYDVDVPQASLTMRASVKVPANVQYAWPHSSRRHLYVVWSDGARGDNHGVSAFDIDPRSGALTLRNTHVPLRARPVHITVDDDDRHLLVSYNIPPTVTVHRLLEDGSIGDEVPQAGQHDYGIYLHQVRVEPSSGTVIVVARGTHEEAGRPGDPGALTMFDFKNGGLTPRGRVAPGGGRHFHPRHVDFHPTRRWMFASLEAENTLEMFRLLDNGSPEAQPSFSKSSLSAPKDVRTEHRQIAGTVHVHPNGRFVYQANRGTGVIDVGGRRVWAGGSNSVAVFRIDGETGEPTLLQNVDSRGLVPRTFSLDPGGRLLVAGNQQRMLVRSDRGVDTVPASLAMFRVRDDGMLDYVRTYDVEAASGSLFWMGIVPLPRP